MTQEAMTTELLNIRKRVEQIVEDIKRAKWDLAEKQRELSQTLEKHNAKRVEFVREELRRREVTWCTRCLDTLPASEAEFILLEGTGKYSHGYENSCYGFRDFSKLHQVCAACREDAFNEHGKLGAYDRLAKDQTKFFAFRVEKREDGYWACKFGDWVKLDNEKHQLPDPPNKVVERLAGEWNLPPRLELDREGKLLVHEPVAMAEAV